MKTIIHSLLLFLLPGMISCGDWLDVQPKTSIQEAKLFESEAGFKDVLTGFYLKMGESSLYAREATYNYVDMLAQLYDEAPDINDWKTIYNYQGTSYRGTMNSFFSQMYNSIANINNFLYYLDKNREVIKTPTYYEIMKGEGLALRAYLHFDLLRMFGPIYKDAPKEKAIPYRVKFTNETAPVLSAEEVVKCILSDLNQADSLLESNDSKIFRMANKTEDAFLAFRQLRMNAYAVKASLARVYCYMGDVESKQMAFNFAKQVVESGRFPLCESNSAKDRILFQEHVFSLNVYELYKIVNADFQKESYDKMLSIKPTTFKELFDKDAGGATDFRCNNIAFKEVLPDQGGDVKIVLDKYNQTGYSGQYSGVDIIPLIRMPEMYYILAECDTDPENSASYIDEVRFSRTIPTSDATDGKSPNYDKPDTRPDYLNGQTMRTNELMREYRKEFYGEGQLFYFYKRNNYATFYHCPLESMKNKYQFPLPDNEIIFGDLNK